MKNVGFQSNLVVKTITKSSQQCNQFKIAVVQIDELQLTFEFGLSI